MPRGRMLLKSISQSRKLAMLKNDSARLLYTWTLPHLDINGCFHADPLIINGIVFTLLDKKPSEIAVHLKELQDTGLIIIFEYNGEKYLFFPDFKDKQPNLRPNHEGKPLIPNFDPAKLQPTADLTTTPDGTKKTNESQEEDTDMDIINEFWAHYNTKLLDKGWIKRKLQLTHRRKQLIKSRLKEGASLDDLKKCVDKMCADKWLDRKKYCDLQYCIGIVRGIDNLEKWTQTDIDSDSGGFRGYRG